VLSENTLFRRLARLKVPPSVRARKPLRVLLVERLFSTTALIVDPASPMISIPLPLSIVVLLVIPVFVVSCT
jgi:hypothetical protein